MMVNDITQSAFSLKETNPTWRDGQCLFNSVELHSKTLATVLRGSNDDPFHNDDNISKAWDIITKFSLEIGYSEP